MYGELPEGFQLNQVKAEKLLVKGTVGVISSDPSFVERRVLFTTRYLLNLRLMKNVGHIPNNLH